MNTDVLSLEGVSVDEKVDTTSHGCCSCYVTAPIPITVTMRISVTIYRLEGVQQ
jgi:hypothetical protein